jgi:hypothetical protein
MSDELAAGLLAELHVLPARVERARSELEKRTRFAPVMRLVPIPHGHYALFRMTYRGEGGWSRWALGRGSLDGLASKYVKEIGTAAFFELH